MPSLRTLVSLCVFSVLLAGCATVHGSGDVTAENRTISGVSRVVLGGDADLEIEQTGKESLVITADDNILPVLRSEMEDGVLVLGVKDYTNIKPTKRVHYKLTLTGLTALSLAGDVTASVKKLATDRLTVSITGDGTIQIDGTADRQDISILGDGKYDAANFLTKDANVSITGDGKLDIAVSENLDVKILGDGSITYTGNPKITRSVLGDGKIEKK
jgi:hypothetical protein